jgi:hypothetical protein
MRLLAIVAVLAVSITGAAAEAPPAFNPSVTVASSSTIDSGAGAEDWVGRASIVRRPSDDALVMAYYQATNHFNNEGALHLRFSDDHGATWTAEDTKLGGGAVTGFPMNPPGAGTPPDAGEPQLYVAPNGDLLIHMWLIDYSTSMGGSWQSRSTDGGETWSTPAQIAFNHPTEDDDIIFSTDDWFALDGVLYAGARIYTGGSDGRPSESILIKSADDGTTWEYVSTIMSDAEGDSPDFGGQEVGFEYVGNDTIVAMIRENPHTKSFQRVSTDMGVTWGTLTNVTSTVGIAGRQRVYTRSHLQGLPGWWNDPVLFMVGFVHQTSGDTNDRRAAVWISPDRGTTWDGPHYLNTTTEDGGYGDIFYDADTGRYVVVTYTGSLNTASLVQYNLTVDLAP